MMLITILRLNQQKKTAISNQIVTTTAPVL